MKHRTKLFLVAFAMIVGTLLLMAGAGTGPRYVGRFFGDGTGLSNSVDLVEGPNILITPGPGNRAYTIESTAAGAAGIFTNGIMGYGDEYRTNYVRISPGGVSLTGGGAFAGDGSGLTNIPKGAIVGLTNLSNLTITNGARMTNVTTLGLTNYGNLGTYNLHLWDPTQTTWTRLFVDDFTFNFSGLSVSNALFYGDGGGLTGLDGSQVTAGTVADARIASTIARDSEVARVNLLNALTVGVTGDGTTDDTAALQAAFNVTTNGIYMPPGTYLVTSTLTLSGYPRIVGAGVEKTFIKAGAGLEGGNIMQLATDTAMSGGSIENLSIDGSSFAANGIVAGGPAGYTNATGYLKDLSIKWCTNAGLLVLASEELHVENCNLSYNYHGIYSTTNTSGDHSTTLYVDHCRIQANTNTGVYLNYAHTFRFRDNVIQGSGGPGVWFNHGGQLLSWAFTDVLFDGNYFEQNNITATYRQVGQVRMDTHATYPADKIVFKDNYFNSPGGNITTNFFYIGPSYTVLRDNYFTPAWGCITVSNAATVNIMGSSVNTGNTDETAGLCGPDVFFQNTTTALPANPNISWTYIGQTNNSDKTVSPKGHFVFVNGGAGHLVPISQQFGSTSGGDLVTRIQGQLDANLVSAINVMAPPFNAKNVNTPDATAAIQQALNYARTNDAGRRMVFMPSGTYRVDGTLWIPTGVTLQGEGRGAYSTLINKNFAGAAIAITNGYSSVKHLTITTDDSPSTGIYGIMTGFDGTSLVQLDTPHIEDVFVSMFEIGFYVRNTWTGEIVDCTARDNVKGIVFTNTVNSMRIEGGHYAANTNGIWIDMTTSAEVTIKNASIEGNKQRGVYAADVRGPLTIEQNYFEVNGGSGIYTGGYDIDVDGGASAVNLRIAGNYFNSTHTNIFVKDVVNAEIIGNRFEGGGGVYTNDTYIVADSGCAGLILENNSFPDTGTNYLSDVPSYFSVQTNVVVKGGSVTAVGFASTLDTQTQPVIIMVQNTNTASANWTNTTLVNQVYYISGGTNVVVGINDLTTVMSWPSYIGNATVILQPTEWLLLDYDSNPQVVRKAF